MPLRGYQNALLNSLSDKIATGKDRLIAVLPTGGGKTECFAEIVGRYIQRTDKNVVILVHREELLKQARQKIYHRQGIVSEVVKASVKHWPPARVHVCMVETAFNRLKKKPNWFQNVGMIIIDECHLDNFTKTFPFFQNAIILGFTASPIAASKRKPLKDFYEDIVVGAQIEELITLWETDKTQGLVPNVTFNAENVSHAELRIGASDFNEEIMAAVYSTAMHVNNTVEAYRRLCNGEKTLVFNCNKDHSKLVNQAFIDAGFNSRHLDSDAPDFVRTETLRWFAETPDAVLNNIGILTTGFDEPSIRWVIVNKATLSLPLWLQMNGRGSRPYPGKEFFGTIDMGNNWTIHGEWSNKRNWERLFFNPGEPPSDGIGGVKLCPSCGALIPVSMRTCRWCNAELIQTKEQAYDMATLEFKLVTKKIPAHINIADIIDQSIGRNEFYALHHIKHKLVSHYKVETITHDIANELIDLYQEKVQEWCKLRGKDYTQWVKEVSGKWLLDELKNVYSYSPEGFTLKF